MIFPEENEVAKALLEWRDAGGPVEDVVKRIVDLIENCLETHVIAYHDQS